MAERPRRVPSMSAAAIAERSITYVKETSILKKVPTKKPDDDEPPDFDLREAIIYDKDGNMANILDVHLKGAPFTVQGKLGFKTPLDHKYLVSKHVKAPYIQIRNIDEYTIGWRRGDEEEDDADNEDKDHFQSPALWVRGHIGWFEITPHKQFAPIYNHICEAITLYYGMMNAYEEASEHVPRKDEDGDEISTEELRPLLQPIYSKLDLNDVFLKYAISAGDGVVKSEVVQRCARHAVFLLGHFPREGEIYWEDTTFYKWMRTQHSDVKRQLTKAAATKSIPTSAIEPPPVTVDDSDSSSSSERSVMKSKKRTARRPVYEDVAMVDVASDSSGRQSKAKGKAKAQAPPQTEQFTSRLKEHSTLGHVPGADPSSSTSSQSGVQMLLALIEEIGDEVKDRTRVKTTTINSKVHVRCQVKQYGAVGELVRYYARPLLDSLGSQWQGSVLVDELKASAFQPPQLPDLISIDDIPRQLVRRNRTKKVETPTCDEPEHTPRRSMKNLLPPMTARRSGKEAGLRLATSSRKRYRDIFEDEDSDSGRGSKTAKTSHFFTGDEETDDVSARSTNDQDEDEDEDEDSDAPDGRQPLRLVVRAIKPPSMDPTGPQGTWTCEEQDCDYLVRAADEQEGQELIRQHYAAHEKQSTKITLAMTEATRGHNPINHLLEKIRQAGERSLQHEEKLLNGMPVPKPIKHRLLV